MRLIVTLKELQHKFPVNFGEVYQANSIPYEGGYEVTPDVTEQILPTANRFLKHDVVVKKIPENYGLITYNQNKIVTIS